MINQPLTRFKANSSIFHACHSEVKTVFRQNKGIKTFLQSANLICLIPISLQPDYWSNWIHSFKYFRFITWGCTVIMIRKSEFVVKIQFIKKV